jgi:plastocyanin
LTFANNDPPQIHNVEIFTNSSASTRLGGATGPTDIVQAGQTKTYNVGPLPPGTYYFHCDIHPTTMTGTFIVAK